MSNSVCTFIGCLKESNWEVYKKIKSCVDLVYKMGVRKFLIRTTGVFYEYVLDVCYSLRWCIDNNIEINIVAVSWYYKEIQREHFRTPFYDMPYKIYKIDDVDYEDEILITYKKMIDEVDIIIFYLGNDNTYVNQAYEYAKQKNKKIIILDYYN